jgi:plastocyanin
MNVTVENAMGSSTPGCEPDCFLPSTVTIGVGGMVTFANNDSAAHTSTAGTPADGPSGVWDSSLVMMGAAYTTPALDAGEYPYFCMVHPWMEGLVIVTDDHNAVTSTPPIGPLTFYIDKTTYTTGDTIIVTGSGATSSSVTTVVKNPDGDILTIKQAYVNSNGTFEEIISTGGALWDQDGFYSLDVVDGPETLFVEFLFSNSPINSHVIENAMGSSTPGCEPDCFIPSFLIVDPGDIVTFVNNDSAGHTSTSGTPADGPDGNWDSSLMSPGYGMDVIFEISDAGQEFPYFCMVHPWMEGTIIVSGGGATSPSQAESSQAQDDAAERIAAAEAAAAAAEAEAAARIAEAEAAARIAAAEAAAAAAEAASQQAISELSVNEKIEITMDFTNDSNVQQSFALIVQIKDSNNTTISLSHVTGMLGAGQTLDQVLSYTPTEAGTYTVEKFLWNNFADPTALTDSKETFSLTVS